MTDAERKLCDWQYERSGSFYKHLFEAIKSADSENLDKMELAFPEEVRAFCRYATVAGYWQKMNHEYRPNAIKERCKEIEKELPDSKDPAGLRLERSELDEKLEKLEAEV